MQLKLLKSLANLDEEQLTKEIVIPLIHKLHPGKIEYTHSPIEGGRDIVSFGYDQLKRQDILCVQVKAKQISFGASFGIIQHTTTIAKNTGVTRENGQKCFPSEVWFISSHAFPEQKRRQVADIIETLERQNIKIIGGEELCSLLIDNCPEVADNFSKYSSPEVINLISQLFKHSESRAFGFPIDRNINEFYITATLLPASYLAFEAIADNIIVSNHVNEFSLNLTNKLIDEYDLRAITKDNAISLIRKAALDITWLKEFIEEYNIYDEFTINVNFKHIRENIQLEGAIPLSIRLKLRDGFNKLKSKTIAAVNKCPKELSKNVLLIRSTCDHLLRMDNYINFCERIGAKVTKIANNKYKILRVKISNIANLINIDRFLLIEGQPGCGKTTLLKMLTIDLLDNNKKVLFLQCCNIPQSYKELSLEKIAIDVSKKPVIKNLRLKECILVIDGLDEAPFDLSDHIICSTGSFLKVIASTRLAYETLLRNEFYSLGLAPFTRMERKLFFEKWFGNQKDLIDKAQELISKYQDIDIHTRIPLIATIMVSLIQNGQTPKTRAEIYEYRLDLLLSKWDRFRGVKRIYVDNPEAKRRFLRQLAFSMHRSRKRTVTKEELRDIYEGSLGKWGYDYDFNNIITDLIVGSGIIIEERPGTFSLGHLTFQEHLVAEYLAQKYHIVEVVHFVGEDWWKEVLNFYASIVGNIDELIQILMRYDYFDAYVPQLSEMINYAPYTSPGAVDSIRDCLMEIELRKDDHSYDEDDNEREGDDDDELLIEDEENTKL